MTSAAEFAADVGGAAHPALLTGGTALRLIRSTLPAAPLRPCENKFLPACRSMSRLPSRHTS